MLGDLIPVMTGVAMAGATWDRKQWPMTWIGDGGKLAGVFHEGLNFAPHRSAVCVDSRK